MHTETSGFVRSGAHDRAIASPRDDHRLAAQLGIIALLDRSVKGIHVDVDDFAHSFLATILFRIQNGAIASGVSYGRTPWIPEMHAVVIASNLYSTLAVLVLFLHVLFILWVVLVPS
jgi:hypothetical protein